MKKALVIAALILISNLATLIFSATNADNAEAKKVQAQWVEVDRISKIIEIEPLSSYYFQIKDSTIYENRLESMPVLDVLKRVPNWLRNDLETNLLQLVDIKTDVGDHAAPTLFDIDKDGDYDLVIGTLEGKLLVYENKNGYWLKKGLLNDSTGNPINVGAYAVAVFEDITGDSALDLVLGAYDGRLRVYENTTSGWEFRGYIRDVNGNIIDVGYNSAPAFGWIVYTTRVGDPSPPPDFKDMLIGAGDGKLYRYERTYDGWIRRGTLAPDSETEPPSEIEILDVGNYSKPALVDLNGDCAVWRADLSIGAGDGTLYHYWNTGNRTVTYYDPVDETWYKETRAVWSKDDSVYQYIEKCPYAAPALADLDRNSLMDNDCLIDLVVGREDGHIHIYKNLGTANNPRWDVWPEAASGVEVEHYMKDRNLSKLEKYLNLILDVENEYVDEIAFCLAHISPDVLTDKDVYPEVFKKNAELIYEIDKTIQYANLVEKGDYTTSNYWTTIEYNVSAGAGGAITKYELPRDIYYWFIVHPKITDELPTFINPETGGPAEPPTGKFWREYLFFHADDNYPPDPDVDDNNDGTPDNRYPKEDKPPLLKDKIAGITLLYDGVGYSKSQGYNPTTGYYDYPDPRTWEWSYENHPTGIEIVSNWVKRTLPLSEPESRDGERPIQPVRIAHHHNGNCGELQDLTVAAARTCLIPTAGVCLIGEDHVWSEFYCYDSSREYHWHQWDNQWGGQGGGSVIDNFDFLGSDRGGTGIFKWWGDDHITEVT
ncbi:MAG: VCBS repeat-containing protein, partial [Candidatus Thermoplasmatota archaeon]|nr:VCBS repeat-containing protein [Candidatus Thermoplasmatota archaeon]